MCSGTRVLHGSMDSCLCGHRANSTLLDSRLRRLSGRSFTLHGQRLPLQGESPEMGELEEMLSMVPITAAPPEKGDSVTLMLDSAESRARAVHTGIAGDGASQVGVVGYSASCNGGDGGRTAAILGENMQLEAVTVVAITPTLAVEGNLQHRSPIRTRPTDLCGGAGWYSRRHCSDE